MELKIDRNIYSDACIPLEENREPCCIEALIFNALNDYKLRQIIEDETHDIRTILYAKAFADFDDIDSNDEV